MRKRVNNARFLFFISMKHSLSKLVISSLQSAVIAFFLMAPLLVFAADFSPREVFDFANTDRTTLGLPALRFDEVLSKAAAAKADDMVKNGYFAHTSPQGTTPWYFFEKEGYQYRYAGENLAIHFTDAAGEETAWMASEKHRENILSSKYRDTGVAVVEMPWEGKTTLLTVQLFGTRLGESVSDISLWKNLSGGVPTVSVAAISTVNRNNFSNVLSSASTETPKSQSDAVKSFSFPLTFSGLTLRMLTLVFLGLIGILEMVAAGILYRILIRHRFFQRNATPM